MQKSLTQCFIVAGIVVIITYIQICFQTTLTQIQKERKNTFVFKVILLSNRHLQNRHFAWEPICYSLINNIDCKRHRKISCFAMNVFHFSFFLNFLFEMCPTWSLKGKKQRINWKLYRLFSTISLTLDS